MDCKALVAQLLLPVLGVRFVMPFASVDKDVGSCLGSSKVSDEAIHEAAFVERLSESCDLDALQFPCGRRVLLRHLLAP